MAHKHPIRSSSMRSIDRGEQFIGNERQEFPRCSARSFGFCPDSHVAFAKCVCNAHNDHLRNTIGTRQIIYGRADMRKVLVAVEHHHDWITVASESIAVGKMHEVTSRLAKRLRLNFESFADSHR